MTSLKHLVSAGRRYSSTHQYPTRRALLEAVYLPVFAKLEKDSPEYKSLAISGKVWEDFFKAQNIEPYLAAQVKLQTVLDEADEQKTFFSQRPDLFRSTIRALAKEYAHQSTAIEGNPLPVGDSGIIEDELDKQMFANIDNLPDISAQSLANLSVPSSNALRPSKDAVQVAELRNHIIVSRYLTEVGLSNPGTAGISLTDIKQLSRVMLAGTGAEALYTHGWASTLLWETSARRPLW
ncbi:hypothetical protein MMC16_006757 [Acarospora aff. strigata]|nr:hypothetical protein [Acarospora aff. strigata]